MFTASGRTPARRKDSLLRDGFARSPVHSNEFARADLAGGRYTPYPPASNRRPARSPTSARTPPVFPGLGSSGETSSDGTPVKVSDLPQVLRAALQEGGDDLSHGGLDPACQLAWGLLGRHLYLWPPAFPYLCIILEIPLDVHSPPGAPGGDLAVFTVPPAAGRPRPPGNREGAKPMSGIQVVVCQKRTMVAAYWPDLEEKDAVLVLGGNLANVVAPDDTHVENKAGVEGRITAMTVVQVGKSPRGATSGSQDVPSGGCQLVAVCSNGELLMLDCHSPAATWIPVAINDGVPDASVPAVNIQGVHALLALPRSGAGDESPFLAVSQHTVVIWSLNVKVRQAYAIWNFDVGGLPLGRPGDVQVAAVQLSINSRFLCVLVGCQGTLGAAGDKAPWKNLALQPIHLARKPAPGALVALPGDWGGGISGKLELRIGSGPEEALVLSQEGYAYVAAPSQCQVVLPDGSGRVLAAAAIMEGCWDLLLEKGGIWRCPRSPTPAFNQDPASGLPVFNLSEAITPVVAEGASWQSGSFSDDSAWKAPTENLSPSAGGEDKCCALIGQLFGEFARTGHAPPGAVNTLREEGGFQDAAEINAFTRFSQSLVDSLAKHWSAGSARVMGNEDPERLDGTDVAIATQLADKQRRHMAYLEFLSVTSCHQELRSLQSGALQLILEHGEKLAAVAKLRAMHNEGRARAIAPPGSASVSALWDAVQVAGERMRQVSIHLVTRDRAEVFYTRVSEVGKFFEALDDEGGHLIRRGTRAELPAPLATQAARICQLADALAAALEAALTYREKRRAWYPESTTQSLQSGEVLEAWTCGESLRGSLVTLSSLCMEIRDEAEASNPSLLRPVSKRLFKLGALSLDAYSWTLEARAAAGIACFPLEEEFWQWRDALLEVLKQQAHQAALADAQKAGGNEQALQSVLESELALVGGLARRHCSYKVLLEICEELGDDQSLLSLMKEGGGYGGSGRFSYYVFQRCLERRQLARLLRFGSALPDDLASFLEDHKSLQWLHDILGGNFDRAASTLRHLALSGEASSPAFQAVEPDAEVMEGSLSLDRRRQLLCLSKLSILAANGPKASEKAALVDAELSILAIQESAVEDGLVDPGPVTRRQLAEVCLGGPRQLFLGIFEIFALGGEDFWKEEVGLLRQAWLRAAEEDDWEQIGQVSRNDGWTDAELLEALQATALYAAARSCYGTGSKGSGPDSFPLLLQDKGRLELGFNEGGGAEVHLGTACCVEEILMLSAGFQTAGAVMLDAIKLGRGGGASSEPLDT